MKKTLKKLSLSRETLRALETPALHNANGGATAQTCGNPCSNICTNICGATATCVCTIAPGCQNNTTNTTVNQQ